MHNYKELKIWQKSRKLVKEVYLLSKKFPESENYGLINQLQRSSSSIPSNIAERSGRGSNKEFNRFLSIAISSAFELETQIILCYDLDYLTEKDYNKIQPKIQEIQKMIYRLQNNLKS